MLRAGRGGMLRPACDGCAIPICWPTLLTLLPHPLLRSEWADFDEKLGESVSIMGISSEFRTHKR